MLIDNYFVNKIVLDFIESQEVPNLDESMYLELAPKFTDYQYPNFIYKLENSQDVFHLEPDYDGIKSDLKQIEFVEDKSLNLSDEEIRSFVSKEYQRKKAEFYKELDGLSLRWSFEINESTSEIKIYEDKPEEDLMWTEEATTEFSDYIEENTKENAKNQILQAATNEDEETVKELLNLQKLWTEFKPQTQINLYAWKRDPQSALEEILNSADSYKSALETNEIAIDLYDFYGDK